MKEDDIPSVLGIEEISFAAPWSEKDFLNELYNKSALTKVAAFENNIIGYICINYHLHESQILNLAVHPDFRRRGVATILMDNAIGELKKRGCVFVYLKVRVSNAGAQKFYELLGFKVKSIRKKYYDNPDEDALVMMQKL
ncbi:MAG: ribosomal-protein-alanine N-acetyltransferase [Nitrospirae bacterium RBG_13_43_8]|nr:MAG: ribosomal-protein-alanine N-acetyltransferase [Nitrospirae bacterium RBG_13_43_8]